MYTAPLLKAMLFKPHHLRWGLRGKAIALLLGATLLVLAIALAVGWRAVATVRQELGAALARDNAQLAQQRITAKLGQEIALVRRFADSDWLQDWLGDENNPDLKLRFQREAEKYRQAFADGGYFTASARSLAFYYAEAKAPSPRRAYTIQADNLENAWYFATLKAPDGLWINVNFNTVLYTTNVWVNALARDSAGVVHGVVGTGINLTHFIAELLTVGESGTTTMIVNQQGAIVAHPDIRMIQFDLAQQDTQTTASHSHKSLFHRVVSTDTDNVRNALAHVNEHGGAVAISAVLDGEPRMLGFAAVPSLHWTVVTVVDLRANSLFNPARIATTAGALLGTLVLLFGVATLGVHLLVLRPLARLAHSVQAVGQGDYRTRLSSTRKDEIGDLTRAFDAMAQKINTHTETLEQQVAERTADLANSHQKTAESIRYASLIQSAIVPERALAEQFSGESFALWLPRDVVGGDFYLFRPCADGFLFGVIDCAGHGVPGACMTMLAHAALDVALTQASNNDPATLLFHMDRAMRTMLPSDRRIAANMDIGLVHIHTQARQATFAGAKMDLIWSDGSGDCNTLPGARSCLNARKPGVYSNTILPLPLGRVCYLLSDGLLDQSGGADGYAFGVRRWHDWMAENAHQPLAVQHETLTQVLTTWRQNRAQRDDITVLAFKLGDG